MKKILLLVYLTFIFLTLSACSEDADMVDLKWKEEVKLNTGPIVIATQLMRYRPTEVAAAKGLLAIFQLTIEIPSVASTPIVWDGRVSPLAINIGKDGQLYLVGIARTQDAGRYYSLGMNIQHVAFKYDVQLGWKRVSLASVPLEISPNLLVNLKWLEKNPDYQSGGATASKIINIDLKDRTNQIDPAIPQDYRKWPRD